jgi:hypothetical protein
MSKPAAVSRIGLILVAVGWIACHSTDKSAAEHSEAADSIVMRFRVSTAGPAKTELITSSSFDRKTRRLKEEIQKNGTSDSMISRYYYNYPDTLLEQIRAMHDGIRYVLRKGRVEQTFLDGILTSRTEYDTHNNQVRSVWFMNDGQEMRKLSNEHRYTYDAKGRMHTETFIVDGEPVYRIAYHYDKQGRLETEQYLEASPRRDSPDMPPDWIQYEYDENGLLFRKIIIIDRTVKKPYKTHLQDFYNQVDVITFAYDKKGRLSQEWLYTSAVSMDETDSIRKLANESRHVSNHFTYRYYLASVVN